MGQAGTVLRGTWTVRRDRGEPQSVAVTFAEPSDGPWTMTSPWRPAYEDGSLLRDELAGMARDLVRAATGAEPAGIEVGADRTVEAELAAPGREG